MTICFSYQKFLTAPKVMVKSLLERENKMPTNTQKTTIETKNHLRFRVPVGNGSTTCPICSRVNNNTANIDNCDHVYKITPSGIVWYRETTH